jgi:hypothetical protein
MATFEKAFEEVGLKKPDIVIFEGNSVSLIWKGVDLTGGYQDLMNRVIRLNLFGFKKSTDQLTREKALQTYTYTVTLGEK